VGRVILKCAGFYLLPGALCIEVNMWHPDMPDEYKNQIVTGDARVLAERIPDESVDLIFTDPVYQNIDDYRWLAETAARVLKPGGDVLVYLATYHLDKVLAEMGKCLTYRWCLSSKKMSSGTLIWSYGLFTHVIPILWFTKGKPRKGPMRIDFKWKRPEGGKVNHGWSKGALDAKYWLAHFGFPTDIVWEAFCGGGGILEACAMLGRHYIAFEIDPETAERARERVRNTQPPLFVPEPEQLELIPA
jgi:SAM-dependent methyltransferase